VRKLNIYIPGKPISWARPGQCRSVRYDTQRRIKNQLGSIILHYKGNQLPLEGKIELNATFYFQKPKSREIKDFDYCCNLSDLDNLLKFYLDLCQDNICFGNDRQICRIVAEKQYRQEGPGTLLVFSEIGDLDE